MKSMMRPAMATAGMHASIETLPKFNSADTNFSVSLLGMRVGVFAGMLAMTAMIIAL